MSVNSTLGGGSLRLSTPPGDNNATYSPPPAKSLSPSSSRRVGSPEHPRQNLKKRSYGYIDRDAPEGNQDFSYSSGRGRGSKSQRRGVNSRGDSRFDTRWVRGGGDFANGDRSRNVQTAAQQPLLGGLPLITPGATIPGMPMPGMPWGTDPMSQFLAAQAAVAAAAVGGWPMLPFAMPSLPQIPHDAASSLLKQPADPKKLTLKTGQDCKDYGERGYCMQGDMCPFEHGGDRIVVLGENEDEGAQIYIL